jgi:AraC-like DNA-binding protein
MRVSLSLPDQAPGAVVMHRAAERPLFDPRPHRHEELEFNLTISGHGRVLCQGRWHELRPGIVLWLFPGQEHMLMEQDAAFSMWVVVWRPALVRRQARLLGASGLACDDPQGEHRRRLTPSAARRIGELCSCLADEPHPHRRSLGFTWLLADAWRQGSATEPSARLPAQVEQAIRLIQHGSDDLPLEALAAACGVSPAWLSRSFSRHVGLSISAFRARTRLARVLDRWRPGDNLLQLAMGAGFGSYNRFHAACRRWAGCSPRAWVAAGGSARL